MKPANVRFVPMAGLGNWGNSADGPLLWPSSLLTGNFTGNFTKLRHRERQKLRKKCRRYGAFKGKFPTQTNRELFFTEQRIFT